MNPPRAINELQVFQATPRRREKPTVPLTNVLIVSTAPSPAPVDLFDALFKGPFTATATYIHDGTCKLKCTQPSPCRVQMSNIEKFAIEEDIDVDPPSVKVYFEGTLAWYQIVSPHPSYISKFADMKLKAEIWLWIQRKRSNSLHRPPSLYVRNPRSNKRWPSLSQVRHDLPPHFTSRTFDPIDAFHPYFIERIIQSHLSEETLAVGPEGIDPKWMECSLARDLENAYPAIWRSIYDRVEVTVNQGWPPRSQRQQAPLSPISMRAKVQKPSKETRILQQLFLINAAEVTKCPDLATVAQFFLTLPQPWHNLTHSELLEKIENHAEALLSDSAFVNALQDWSGIDEIKAFCTDKKWWKHRRVLQIKSRPRDRPRLSQESSYGSSVPRRSRSLESTSVDLSQDDNVVDLTMETPSFPKTAKKGTSILRPRFSMDHTPGTPTKNGDSQSDMLVDSDHSTDDDELQLLQVPPDVSTRMQGDQKPITRRKRKIEANSENRAAKKSKRSFQFGRGRPPLTTVPIPLPSHGRTTVFHCPFPSCSYKMLNSTSPAAKAEIDKHHRTHRNEIRDALDMLKDPFIVGGRVGGEKGNRLIRPIGGIEHLIDRIEEMAKDLGGTPSKRIAV